MKKRKTLSAKYLCDLVEKVRKENGWSWVEGQSRSKRVCADYAVYPDHKKGLWVATPKEPQ